LHGNNVHDVVIAHLMRTLQTGVFKLVSYPITAFDTFLMLI